MWIYSYFCPRMCAFSANVSLSASQVIFIVAKMVEKSSQWSVRTAPAKPSVYSKGSCESTWKFCVLIYKWIRAMDRASARNFIRPQTKLRSYNGITLSSSASVKFLLFTIICLLKIYNVVKLVHLIFFMICMLREHV